MGEEKRSVDREGRYEEGTAEDQEAVENFIKRIEERERQKRRIKINESRYNRKYKEMLTEELPRYLLGKKKKKDRMLIVRYRCGSEVKSSQHWREEEDRRCRLCQEEKREEENLDHILKECEATKSEIQLEEFLREEGKGSEV